MSAVELDISVSYGEKYSYRGDDLQEAIKMLEQVKTKQVHLEAKKSREDAVASLTELPVEPDPVAHFGHTPITKKGKNE